MAPKKKASAKKVGHQTIGWPRPKSVNEIITPHLQDKKKDGVPSGDVEGASVEELNQKIATLEKEKNKEEEYRNYMQLERVSCVTRQFAAPGLAHRGNTCQYASLSGGVHGYFCDSVHRLGVQDSRGGWHERGGGECDLST